MKFNTTLLSKNTGKSNLALVLLGAALISLNSCKTDVPEPEIISALAITNASSSTPSVDFVIEGTKVNGNPLLFGQKVDYVRAYPGSRTGEVYATGVAKSLYSAKFDLTAGLYHSLYILSSGAATDGTQLSYLLVKDEYKSPVADKAQIRFANLSSDAPSLDLELQGDTTSFSDRAYKALTPYKYVKPAIFKVLLKNKGTNTVVASLDNVELKANKYYTIWAKGLYNTDVVAQKISIQLSEHFN
jgi:hypothetical protein